MLTKGYPENGSEISLIVDSFNEHMLITTLKPSETVVNLFLDGFPKISTVPGICHLNPLLHSAVNFYKFKWYLLLVPFF
jgi:hypothetical protein